MLGVVILNEWTHCVPDLQNWKMCINGDNIFFLKICYVSNCIYIICKVSKDGVFQWWLQEIFVGGAKGGLTRTLEGLP